MPFPFESLIRSRTSLIALAAGVAYGIVARFAVTSEPIKPWFGVMTVSFLVLVPLAIGALAVADGQRHSVAYRLFAPWVPMAIVIAGAAVAGWEGSICIYMAIPLVFPVASVGGLLGGSIQARMRARSAVLALPFITAPFESRMDNPVRMIETTREIVIDAAPAAVWPYVASVDSIRPEEQRRSLYITMGFPRPISATLSHEGVGGTRRAKLERGLVFREIVTDWEPGRRISFTVDGSSETIPRAALDEHVAIGGEYFDVISGTYELVPLDGGRRTRLILTSVHRVSTHFNPYAGWWTDRIMASIQSNILEIHKQRAETTDVGTAD